MGWLAGVWSKFNEGGAGVFITGEAGGRLRVGYCNYRADPRMKRNTGDCQKSNSSTNEVKCSRTHCLGFRFWCTTSRSRCSRSYLHKYRDFFFSFHHPNVSLLWCRVYGGGQKRPNPTCPSPILSTSEADRRVVGLSSKYNNRRPGLGGPAH